MKHSLLLFVLLAITASSCILNGSGNAEPSESYSQLIGRTFPPYPTDMQSGYSGLIGNSDGQDWAISVVRHGDNLMLWLESSNAPAPTWELRDIVVLPKQLSDYLLIPSGCLFNSVEDPTLIAVAEDDPSSSAIRFAGNSLIKFVWRVDIAMGTIEELATEGVECYLDTAIVIP